MGMKTDKTDPAANGDLSRPEVDVRIPSGQVVVVDVTKVRAEERRRCVEIVRRTLFPKTPIHPDQAREISPLGWITLFKADLLKRILTDDDPDLLSSEAPAETMDRYRTALAHIENTAARASTLLVTKEHLYNLIETLQAVAHDALHRRVKAK